MAKLWLYFAYQMFFVAYQMFLSLKPCDDQVVQSRVNHVTTLLLSHGLLVD